MTRPPTTNLVLFCVFAGAGCGLAALALHCAGFEVVATDKSVTLELLRSNVDSWLRLCGEERVPPISVQELDWLSAGAATSASEVEWQNLLGGRVPDLLVCSDCVYSSASVEPLLAVLEQVRFAICVPLCGGLLTDSLQLPAGGAAHLGAGGERAALGLRGVHLPRQATPGRAGIVPGAATLCGASSSAHCSLLAGNTVDGAPAGAVSGPGRKGGLATPSHVLDALLAHRMLTTNSVVGSFLYNETIYFAFCGDSIVDVVNVM